MKKILLTIILFLSIFVARAQQPALTWAKNLGGTGSDYGYAIAVDASGNVYTTGYFQGIADFDPSGGIFNLTSAGLKDIFISKADAAGNLVWAKNIGGRSLDMSRSIKLDASGNIYITGYFNDTVDFNPGAGTSNLISAGGADIFILKLDAAGNFVWVKQMGGYSGDYVYALTFDPSGAIYVTGDFGGTADFDPGSGVFNLTSAGSQDVCILKLDTNGDFVWARNMGGASNDHANSIVADAAGNVYSIGYFQDTADLDPGPAIINFTHTNSQGIFISKLDDMGNFVWAQHLGGTHYNDGFSIALSNSGHLYTTGYFQDTADFDPGTGVANLISSGAQDVFVLKLETSGNFVWAKNIGGKSPDIGFSIAVDSTENCYLTGIIQGNTDFDPGAGTYNLKLNGVRNQFFLKLDYKGNFVWARTLGSSAGITEGYGLVLDASANLFCTGHLSGAIDVDPNTGIFNLTSSGSDDIFIFKMNQNGAATAIDNTFDSKFVIYPNPTNGLLNITFSNPGKNVSVEVYNSTGTLVYSQTNPRLQNTIDLGNEGSGIYIVKIMEDGKMISSQKIIRQ